MPITRRYPLSAGKPAGELRLSGPHQTKWFHGTNDEAADAIVESQRLRGDGDYGEGGYLTSTADDAVGWARALTSAKRYRETRDQYEYPGVVEAELRPKRPLYGQKPLDRMMNAELLGRMGGGPLHPDIVIVRHHNHDGVPYWEVPEPGRIHLPKIPAPGWPGRPSDMGQDSVAHVLNTLKDKYDVWFPHGSSPRHPGKYAVILDENEGLSAQFTKYKLHPHDVRDFHEDD